MEPRQPLAVRLHRAVDVHIAWGVTLCPSRSTWTVSQEAVDKCTPPCATEHKRSEESVSDNPTASPGGAVAVHDTTAVEDDGEWVANRQWQSCLQSVTAQKERLVLNNATPASENLSEAMTTKPPEIKIPVKLSDLHFFLEELS